MNYKTIVLRSLVMQPEFSLPPEVSKEDHADIRGRVG